ncbi:MAG: Rieske (2Fe-2S) protein [Acidobacteria bacterium]|nr:Rieske (2Fe-2S) protein [Acidobacteriota bacterium]
MSESEKKDPRVTRRLFCQATGLSACAAAAGGTGILSIDFLRPRALFEPPTRFALGPPDAMETGSVVTDEDHRVIVARRADGFRALSSICTHLGCITRYQPDAGVIACPCHGSRFSLDGEVIGGPAPRPLHWLEMSVSDKGLILVDTAVEVPQGTVFKL